MSEYSVGTGFLQVVPSFKGVQEKIDAEVKRWRDSAKKGLAEAIPQGVAEGAKAARPAAQRLGADVGQAVGDGVRKGIRDGVSTGMDEGRAPAKSKGRRTGEDFGGAFADTARRRIAEALQALPEARIDADTGRLDTKLAEVRARLQAISDAHIGVDLDPAAALAEIAALQGDLAALGQSSPDVMVRVESAEAAARLAELQAEIDRMDGRNVNVDVNVDDHGSLARAQAGISGLAATAIGLGPALIPVGATAVGALGGIATVAGAGVGALGTLALGFSGVGDAVKATGAAHDAAAADAQRAARTAASSAAAQVSAANQVKSAQMGLANARANADDAAVRSARQVSNARRGVADAERSAAQQVEQALRQERTAERDLEAAQQSARRAQLDLTQARADAQRQLEDLALQVKDGALAQRQADLDVRRARLELQQTMADPRASQLERQQAQLTYDEAVQRVEDLRVRQQRLVTDKAAADKAGVNGSQQVVSAQQALVAANDRVTQAQQRAKDAAAGVAEARRAGTEQVARAQEALSDALRAQASQQRQSAYSIAQAQMQVSNALAAQARAAEQAGTTQSAAATKLQQSMAKLTPEGRAFVKFLTGTMQPALGDLKATAQAGLLPGVQTGLTALLTQAPAINRVVGVISSALGGLFASAGKALTDPFWTRFFGYIAVVAGPTIATFGQILGNIAKGFAGLIQAFAPVSTQIGQGILGLTRRFADFGANASTSAGFGKFIDFIVTEGPVVAHAIGSIIVVAGKLLDALAPYGAVVLGIVDAVASFLSTLTPGQLLAIASAVAVLFQGVKFGIGLFKAWSTATSLLNAVLAANPIGLVVTALVALAAGVIYAYTHFKWFRAIVDGVFSWLKTAVTAVIGFVKDHWKLILGILTGPFGAAALLIVSNWDTIKGAFSAGFDAVIGAVRHGVAWVVDHFLGMVGAIIRGAANAFGWVPGIGPKLQEAADRFDQFRKDVNDSLSGINDKQITVTVTADFAANRRSVYNSQVPAAARADGGVLPGYTPGRDVHMFTSPTAGLLALSGGEAVMRPEWTAAVGPGYIDAANRAARTGGVGGVRRFLGFATGGIVSLFPPMGRFGQAALGAVQAVTQANVGALFASVPPPEGLSAAVTRWTGVVLAALAQLGQPLALLGAVLRRISLESGGNPRAINLWDSNAAAGHPSQGLMQTIPGTFAAYAGPYRSRGITDPFANIFAGLNYAIHRYGSIGAIDPLVRPYGYDSGGFLQPGLTLTYNGTGRPEPVLTSQQWTALAGQARGGDGLSIGDVHQHFHGPVSSPGAVRDGLVEVAYLAGAFS